MTYITTENKQTILIFKTNITKKVEVKKISSLFNKSEILNWNIDLDDCDKVLRVVTDKLSPNNIISEMNKQGFDCTELE